MNVQPYEPPAPRSAPTPTRGTTTAPYEPPRSSPGVTGGGAPLPASGTSGRIVPADSQAPIDSPRFRARVPQQATELVSGTGELARSRSRSALERLAGVSADSPSAARLSEALRTDAARRAEVDDLLARYHANSRDDADLVSTLERLSSPLAQSRSASARPSGARLDYASGPLRRLSDPTGARIRGAESAAKDGSVRERVVASGADPAKIFGPDESLRRRPALTASTGDASLGLGVSDGIHSTGSDFVPIETVHHYVHDHHYYSNCWYGSSWWYKPWGFGLAFGWPCYSYNYYSPLWLHHPVYGTFPWYGGYACGWYGTSTWYHGSYGAWSWGLSAAWGPYAHTTVYVEDDEPEVVYVDREVIVEVPVEVPVEAPVLAPSGGGALAPVPELDGAAQPNAIGVAADRYLTLGDRAFRDGRFADAVHYYTKAVALEPEQSVLHLLLSDALFATGDYGASAAALRKAFTGDPMLVRSEVDKREFYSEKRAFDRQLAVCELYLADHPMDDEARLVLAVNLLFSGAPASAVDLLEADLALGLRDDPVAELVLETARERQYGRSAAPAGSGDASSDGAADQP